MIGKQIKFHFNFTSLNNILYPTQIVSKSVASKKRIILLGALSNNMKTQQANSQEFYLGSVFSPKGTARPHLGILQSCADPPGKSLSQHRKAWTLHQRTLQMEHHNERDLCHYLMWPSSHDCFSVWAFYIIGHHFLVNKFTIW